MMLKLLAFGIVKDIFGSPSIVLDQPEVCTCKDLKEILCLAYPELRKLTSFMIAVNNNYVSGDQVIEASDEIAIIPPVSGG